jgi:hypothetical protein
MERNSAMLTDTQENCAPVPRAETIGRLNDALRQGRGGAVMVTIGVSTLPHYHPLELMQALANYSGFDPDNDPHGERDFGDLELFGADLLWKIDYYDPSLTFGSNDPADPQQTKRVLTIMLASEY